MHELEACLPTDLRGPATTIERVAAGLSGAGVYRVESGGRAFALKVSSDVEPAAVWRRKAQVQQAAASASLAPRIVHVDEARRAVLSEFVVDRLFAAYFGDPRTREAAIALLGRTVRRVHDLRPPADAAPADARQLLASIWSAVPEQFPPMFVAETIRSALDDEPPPLDRALVLSHNDVNPTNLIYDGERLLLLDWETAAPNDPFYDLATVAAFFRLDERTCLTLLGCYDGKSAATLPPRFYYDRRMVAVLCGTAFLHKAHASGHAGATGAETLKSTLSLGDIYQRLRSGSLGIATGEGQWLFGLALLKESRG